MSQALVTWDQPDEHRTAGTSPGRLKLGRGHDHDAVDDPRCFRSGKTSALTACAALTRNCGMGGGTGASRMSGGRPQVSESVVELGGHVLEKHEVRPRVEALCSSQGREALRTPAPKPGLVSSDSRLPCGVRPASSDE